MPPSRRHRIHAPSPAEPPPAARRAPVVVQHQGRVPARSSAGSGAPRPRWPRPSRTPRAQAARTFRATPPPLVLRGRLEEPHQRFGRVIAHAGEPTWPPLGLRAPGVELQLSTPTDWRCRPGGAEGKPPRRGGSGRPPVGVHLANPVSVGREEPRQAKNAMTPRSRAASGHRPGPSDVRLSRTARGASDASSDAAANPPSSRRRCHVRSSATRLFAARAGGAAVGGHLESVCWG